MDLTASSGEKGTYFLDPTDITIYGNVDPAFVSTDGTMNLATSLKLWLDASDTSRVTLTYSTDGLSGATATGTSGSNTITTSANVSANLAVGARIRLGSAGSVTTAATMGADTYTIASITGTTITLAENLTQNYSGSTLHRGLVSQLADKSGQSNNATQATAANMPLWVSNGQNGLGVALFDGVNDQLGVQLPSLTRFTLDFAFNRTSSSVNAVGLGKANGSTYFGADASGTSYIVNDAGSFQAASTGGDSNPRIELATRSGSNAVSYYRDSAIRGSFTLDGTFTADSVGRGWTTDFAKARIYELLAYNTELFRNARHLVEQYQSAKWGIALTPPGTGATEVAKATASDGYSVFTTRYLERLSQSANVSLQATNNINLDFKGDTLNFATAGRSLTLAAGNQIKTASTGTITTNSGAISLTATNGILLNNAFTLNSQGGNISLNNNVTLGANQTINAGAGTLAFGGTVNGANNLTATAGSMSFAQPLGQMTALGAVSLTSTNALTLPTISASSISASTTTGNLSGVGGLVTSGGNMTLTATAGTLNTSNLSISAGGDVSLTSGGAMTLGTASGKTILARSTGAAADLTIASGKTLSATGSGSSLVLASGRNFINLAGSGALSVQNGRWLVYSADPFQNTLGGLTAGFSQYATTYTGNPPVSIGNAGQNGLLYSLNTVLTFTADNLSRAYGEANPAFTYRFTCGTGCSQGQAVTGNPFLSSAATGTTGVGTSAITIGMGDLALTGAYAGYRVQLVNGTLTVTQAPLTITADSRSKTYGDAVTFAGGEFSASGLRNGETIGSVILSSAGAAVAATVAGGPYTITAAGATGGTFNPANYSISYVPGLLSVASRTLVAGLTGSVSKTYDGTAFAALAAGNYTLTGIYGSDAVAINNPSAGAYDSTGAGAGKVVTVSGLSLSGAASGNYQLSSTTASALIGTITPKSLSILGVTAQDRVYDGTTVASLNNGSAGLSGLVAGDTVNLLIGAASGAFADKNVGTGKGVTASGYTLSGADAGNYSLSQPAGLTASITARSLTIAGVTAQDRTYNGTVTATLNSGSAGLSGVIGGDAVGLVTGSASGAFADKNVGAGKAVTASGYTISGADAGNYSLSQPTGLMASITARSLTIAGVTAQDRQYDGTTMASLTGGSISTGTGLVDGDTVNLLTGSALGHFANKHMETNKTVTGSGYSISGADSGNYALSQPTGLTANITARTLTASLVGSVSKVYDGDVFATLLPANYSMSGKVAGDSLLLNSPGIGTYDTKAVGTGKTVTVSGLGLVGGDAGNYQLASSTISGSVGSITARPLNITGVSAQDKVYDGTTVAALNNGSASLLGVVGGDAVTLSSAGAGGAFADKHVGTGKAVTASGYAISGADSGNYALSQPAGLTASITQRLLSIGGVSAGNKVYDGTSSATLSGGSISTATGLVAGDAVTLVTGSASGSFAEKHVGTGKAVTASGYAISGADSGNYALSQPAGLTASITARGLGVAATAADKVYDGTAAATVTLSDDRIAGDVLAVSYGSAVFDSADAGAGKAVTVSGLWVSGADAGNYQLVSGSAGSSASVFRRPLRVRAHDASVTAGAGMPAFGYSYAGLVAADSQAVFSGGLTSPGGRQSEPGTYPILQGTLGAGGNYTIEYTPGMLTVGFPVGPILTAQSASTRTVQAPAPTPSSGTAAPAVADVKVANPEPGRLLLCVTGSRVIYLVGADDAPAGAACSAY